MPIRVLSETLAAQIAAGEVVERPASAVKELVENSLDAGALSVAVETREGGRRLIRVSDDGCGISEHEVGLAFHRHSTSKLAEAKDLDAIQTLGFRGEALASIASVAQVTMVTRTLSAASGTRIRVEGGNVASVQAVGAPGGTLVAVENLFFNVPARLKFMRSPSTERRHISALVTRYAMAYPSVRFRLIHDGRVVFRSSGSGELHQVLAEVMGADAARKMLPVGEASEEGSAVPDDAQPSKVRVSGYTSQPELSRANRNQISVFVNGRWIQDRGLTFAVVQAYHTLLMTGRYPAAVILVTLPANEVDVNVHPTKAEVRFRDKDAVFSAVQRSVRRSLLGSDRIRSVDQGSMSEGAGWRALGTASLANALAVAMPPSPVQGPLALPGGTAGTRHPIDPAAEWSPHEREGELAMPGRLPIMRVVGQIGAAYIVAEGPDGLVILDQHAAHERILYERFMSQREAGVSTQHLLDAVPVELSADRASLLEAHLDQLNALGFLVEHFGGSTFLVRGMPALLGGVSPAFALEAATDDLEGGERPLDREVEDRLIARVCKTAAVKAGQVLTQAEMSAMVRQLEACDAPYTCPHGRPTMVQLSRDSLTRQFGRE